MNASVVQVAGRCKQQVESEVEGDTSCSVSLACNQPAVVSLKLVLARVAWHS